MGEKLCPGCGSLNTQKRGSYSAKTVASWGKRQRRIQRYWCLDCHKWFSEKAGIKSTKRYESSLILKAADLYFNAEASYRAVGRQLHIRLYQVFLWVNELGKNSKSFGEVAGELSPGYFGYFLADATTDSFRERKINFSLPPMLKLRTSLMLHSRRRKIAPAGKWFFRD